MPDYIYDEVRKEASKYLDFKERTGQSWDSLNKLHKAAVKTLDETPTDEPFPIMAIPARTLAYLTDIALEHISVGAYIENPRRYYDG